MANLPLFLFTLLGGLSAGAYTAETLLQRTRGEKHPWIVPAVILALLAAGAVAATFHVGNLGRAFTPNLNLASGMTREVLIAGAFGILALVDLCLSLAKRKTPYALRVIACVAAVALMLSMGLAYTSVYGNPVWTSMAATVLTFLAGDLLMGVALWALLSRASYARQGAKLSLIGAAALFAVALVLEIVAFTGAGYDIMALIAAIAIAVVGAAALVVPAAKGKSLAPATLILLAAVVGVGISRWAFYATAVI